MNKKNKEEKKVLDAEAESAFRELEAEIREEQKQKIIKKAAPWVAAGAVVIVAVVGIYTWYKGNTDDAANLSASLYLELISTDPKPANSAESTNNNLGEINPKFLELSEQALDKASPGYKKLSEFAIAAANVEVGNYEDAGKGLIQIARDKGNNISLNYIAAIKAALSELTNGGKLQQATMDALFDITSGDSPMRFKAQELLGINAYNTGDLVEARKHFAAILKNENNSPQLEYRITQALRVITSALPSPRQ